MEASPLLPPGMRATYINFLGRHGSRFPSSKDVLIMKNALKIIKDSKNFKEYFNEDFNFHEEDDKILSPHGIYQLSNIGKRYRDRFSEMFSSGCSVCRNFRFGSTCRSRSAHSMISFIDGMFNITENTSQLPEIKIHECSNDFLLRFFDFCPSYTSKQKCLKKHKIEQDLFLSSGYMAGIISKVEKKLSLQNDILTSVDIKALYLICAYSLSMNNGTLNDGACKLFDSESYYIFDYMLDIGQFYKRGNSDSLNIKMACVLYRDVYDSIIKALEECPRTCHKDKKCHTNYGGDFNFAHAETLLPFLVFLMLI